MAGRRLSSHGSSTHGVVRDGAALVAALRATAESTTGEELLRVYWYDDAPHPRTDRDLLKRTAHVSHREETAGNIAPRAAHDLAALLTATQCGDIIVCTNNPDMATACAHAQAQARHVHWLQMHDDLDHVPSPLYDVSDSRLTLSQRDVEAAFRAETDTEHDDRARPPAPVGVDASHTARPVAAYIFDDPFAAPARPSVASALARTDATGSHHRAPPPRPPRYQPAPTSAPGDGPTPHETAPPTDERLHDIAHTVASEIATAAPLTTDVVRRWSTTIPAHIDRQLLGASFARCHTRLDTPQKQMLRRYFLDACAAMAATVETADRTALS